MEGQDKKQKKNKKVIAKKKKKFRILKAMLLFMLLVVMFLGAFIVYSGCKNGWSLSGMIATAVGHDEETLKNLDELKVLILGVSTDTEAVLTDTIMVASYNPKTQQASLLSIPRDTFVGKNESTATSYNKINALYQTSIDKTLTAVNALTNLNIKYYVVVDTEALIEFVNAIGGVEFNVPIDMDYDDSSQDLHIHLKAGLQVLDGEKAENLVRFRHNNNGTSYPASYGDNDIGRMRTQREFIYELAKQTIHIKNITKIGKFIDIAYKYIDTNIAASVLKDYIPYAVEFNAENIKTGSLPGVPEKINGLWFYRANKTKTKQLIGEMFETSQVDNNENQIDEENKKENSKIKIEILNGTSISSNLLATATELKDQGYTILKKGNTTKTGVTAIVVNSELKESVINNIKESLKLGKVIKAKNSISKADVTIIIGEDYNK